ncbi:uncharacterized protein HRG_06302 [Hirsutella rhossiliensis]|uniref:Uncharacterized protein n=1 Tax=Hirsutella rhossiliensis TaxID=111463 RepID=A0A9P8MVU1_9HYPO|nr:uncharacterized protein HRG_06302 [Hirsutella rhossiliensis]KAH0962200.1 hypothetical protein HRG_06302 [Hirsutella rhossiliensis]
MPTPPSFGASADSPPRRPLLLPCQTAAREMRRFNTSSSSSLSSSSPKTASAAAAAAASQPPPLPPPSQANSRHRPAISIRRPFPAPRPDTTTTTTTTTTARRPPPRPPFAAAHHQTFQSKTGPRPPAKTPSSPSSSSNRRPPLRLKDRNQQQNAPLLTSSTLASAAKMPVGDRPRQPQLSAAAARSAKRGPLTPKIAAKGPPSTASIPPPRRPQTIHHPRDDAPTPVSGHVTRPGARQGRVDSLSSAPIGPANHYHPERLAYDAWDNAGAMSGVGGTPGSASGVSRQAGDSPGEQQSDGHKFFYASDARAIQRPLSVPQKPVAFFYANGASAEAKRTTSPPLNQPFTPVLPPTQEPVATKFFYANGTPDPPPSKHALATSASASALSTSSRLPLTTCPPTSQPLSANPLLPTSPKQPLSLQSSPALAPVPHSSGKRRPAMTMASLIQAAEEWKERDTERDGDAQPELSQSPTKSSHAGELVSELVANARRERKVQDLEITNASLEAINRTLERQLRKQTIELRRYRRMSRAGHISLASAASSRVPSAALPDVAIDLSGVDEGEEATEDEQDEYPDSFDESDFSSNESLSADASSSPNDKLAARRKRDERRLQLDLTKHQELLVDSQKMNQSLKRCLDWTEVLIKEGQKALAYQVRVSDVEFGGRVLAPLDEDDEADMDDDDGPSLGPPRTKGSQDRDSGVELPGDGG